MPPLLSISCATTAVFVTIFLLPQFTYNFATSTIILCLCWHFNNTTPLPLPSPLSCTSENFIIACLCFHHLYCIGYLCHCYWYIPISLMLLWFCCLHHPASMLPPSLSSQVSTAVLILSLFSLSSSSSSCHCCHLDIPPNPLCMNSISYADLTDVSTCLLSTTSLTVALLFLLKITYQSNFFSSYHSIL